MSEDIEKLIKKIEECDSLHNNCDYLLEHDECYILIEYINSLKQALNEIRECCEDNAIEVNTREYGNLIVTNIDDILQIIDECLGSGK